ncbi:MAG: hypothetical protein RJB38_1357 [Pseudomonadota bacterium]
MPTASSNRAHSTSRGGTSTSKGNLQEEPEKGALQEFGILERGNPVAVKLRQLAPVNGSLQVMGCVVAIVEQDPVFKSRQEIPRAVHGIIEPATIVVQQVGRQEQRLSDKPGRKNEEEKSLPVKPECQSGEQVNGQPLFTQHLDLLLRRDELVTMGTHAPSRTDQVRENPSEPFACCAMPIMRPIARTWIMAMMIQVMHQMQANGGRSDEDRDPRIDEPIQDSPPENRVMPMVVVDHAADHRTDRCHQKKTQPVDRPDPPEIRPEQKNLHVRHQRQEKKSSQIFPVSHALTARLTLPGVQTADRGFA